MSAWVHACFAKCERAVSEYDIHSHRGCLGGDKILRRVKGRRIIRAKVRAIQRVSAASGHLMMIA